VGTGVGSGVGTGVGIGVGTGVSSGVGSAVGVGVGGVVVGIGVAGIGVGDGALVAGGLAVGVDPGGRAVGPGEIEVGRAVAGPVTFPGVVTDAAGVPDPAAVGDDPVGDAPACVATCVSAATTWVSAGLLEDPTRVTRNGCRPGSELKVCQATAVSTETPIRPATATLARRALDRRTGDGTCGGAGGAGGVSRPYASILAPGVPQPVRTSASDGTLSVSGSSGAVVPSAFGKGSSSPAAVVERPLARRTRYMPTDRSTMPRIPGRGASGSAVAPASAPPGLDGFRLDSRETRSATAMIATVAAMMMTGRSSALGPRATARRRHADSAARCYHRFASQPLGWIP
jgi:hypothetical protein